MIRNYNNSNIKKYNSKQMHQLEKNSIPLSEANNNLQEGQIEITIIKTNVL